jgi:hypothetical protein
MHKEKEEKEKLPLMLQSDVAKHPLVETEDQIPAGLVCNFNFGDVCD